jgi:hypothetical protein
MPSEAKPWLSVVLPTHNGEQWVGATLDSFAIQADPGIEIVIVDTSDGPETRRIIEGYSDRLQLRFIDPAGAEGCMAKTNRAVSQARADHISWLCQDDLWLPGRVAAACRWISEDPDAPLHIAPAVIVDRTGRTLGKWRCPLSAHEREPDRERLLAKLLVQNFLFAGSLVVRRDAWLAVGGLDARLGYTGDWDLWLKLAAQGRTRYHPDVTAGFRVHDQSATVHLTRARDDCIEQQTLVVERHIGSIPAARAAHVRRMARASAHINADLAEAAGGSVSALFRACWHAARLGPLGLASYLDSSRVVDRSLPRLRARLAGAF